MCSLLPFYQDCTLCLYFCCQRKAQKCLENCEVFKADCVTYVCGIGRLQYSDLWFLFLQQAPTTKFASLDVKWKKENNWKTTQTIVMMMKFTCSQIKPATTDARRYKMILSSPQSYMIQIFSQRDYFEVPLSLLFGGFSLVVSGRLSCEEIAEHKI